MHVSDMPNSDAVDAGQPAFVDVLSTLASDPSPHSAGVTLLGQLRELVYRWKTKDMTLAAASALLLCTELRSLDLSRQGPDSVRTLAHAGVLTALTKLEVRLAARSNGWTVKYAYGPCV